MKTRLMLLAALCGTCAPDLGASGVDCVLDGAVGAKAARLFEHRLTGERARTDVFDETVNAFRTRYDDLHPTPEGTAKSGYWQGEYWGKGMLSHCAHARYTGSAAEKEFIRRKALELVAGFQKPDGYLATYDDPDFIRGWTWNVWGRKYTMWALVEAYDLTKEERLLDAAVKMVGHLDGQLKRLKADLGETGSFAGLPSMSILKPLVLVYERTKCPAALELAKAIVARNDRADGVCPNLIANAFSERPLHTWYPHPEDWAKAYELMSVVEGFIAYSELTGERRPLEAAKRIFDKLAEDEMNGVGSVGYHDHFIGARACPNAISESCDVIHWMRLCKFLHQATGDGKYLDFWERAFYNAFLAGVFRDGKWATHDVRSHGRRHLQGVFEVNMHYHFCCIANDPRGFCDWADAAVEAKGPSAVDLNFFSDGTYAFDGARIAVTGNYPVGDRVTVRVTSPRAMEIGVRVPGWSGKTTVDGRRADGPRVSLAVPAGESEHEIAFDMSPRIEAWASGKSPDPALAHYLWDNFEMPMHNKEMAGFLRSRPGMRLWRGPLILAKCALAGARDRQVFDDLGIDETWRISLAPRANGEVWGCWDVTFERDGVRKSVPAADYSSSADFDDGRNSFSIWF